MFVRRPISIGSAWSPRTVAPNQILEASRTITFPICVHRSDGCAAQFKQKNEALWLAKWFQADRIHVTHSFFQVRGQASILIPSHTNLTIAQSCHGKGPSDSEGAAVKCALRRVELCGEYFADTEPAVRWSKENLTIDQRPCEAVYKHRHNIGKRDFFLVCE